MMNTKKTHASQRSWAETQRLMEEEHAAYIRKSDEATRRTISDNQRAAALLKQEKAAQSLRVGLAAVRASGITKEAALEMVAQVFGDDEKAKA